MFKAERLLYHSTLGSRVMKKKRKREDDRGWVIVVVGAEPASGAENSRLEDRSNSAYSIT